ncbi:MAG: L,D-transpeptidase family protein [Phycisphaerae bacterium]
MAKRRKRGLIRRALGGLVFLGILGGAFWWVLPLVRSTSQDAPAAPKNLVGIAPSPTAATQPGASGSPLRPIEAKPSASVAAPVPVPGSRPAVEAADLPRAQAACQAGMRAIEQNPVEARRLLSEALAKGLTGPDAEQARRKLNELGERMIFSPVRTPGDPLVAAYTVKAGDTVGKIAAAHNISEELLAQINQLRNKNFVRLNQTLKVVQGPFHAVVDKSQHEMYIILGDVYVRDFRVALGMNGGTPTGKWIVANHLTNPSWVDPRTGKRWHADDPQNPIGEYWIGLQGIEGEAKGQIGFGIHGTIDEASIGQDVSMGCIRLAARDIEMVYKLLVPGKSTVVVKD